MARSPVAVTNSSEPLFEPSIPEVLAAVQSLYTDDLKPLGRLVLKRLREHLAEAEAARLGLALGGVDPESVQRIDPKRLRMICEGCQELRVTSEEGKEYSVALFGQHSVFLDVCSPQDLYPEHMWASFMAYLRQDPEGETKVFPCGRYACARMLVSLKLPFFQGLSLGQVCHIVQLSISQKRLLGHKEGQIVPFHSSEEWAKECCAFRQQHFPSKKTYAMPVATWEQTIACLQKLLAADSGPEPGAVTLSNVKRLFRSQFGLELSETSLGHARLLELLEDPRFNDVCTVHVQGNGQVLVRRVDKPLPWYTEAMMSSSASGGRVEAGDRVPMLSSLAGAVAPPPAAALHQWGAIEPSPSDTVCLSTMPMVSQPQVMAYMPAVNVGTPSAIFAAEYGVEYGLPAAEYGLPVDFGMALEADYVAVPHVFEVGGAQIGAPAPLQQAWGVSPGVSPRGSAASSSCGPVCPNLEQDMASRYAHGGLRPKLPSASGASSSAKGSGTQSFCTTVDSVCEERFSDVEDGSTATRLSSSLVLPDAAVTTVVKNTFIDFSPKAEAEECWNGTARRRTKSEPKDIGSPKRVRGGVVMEISEVTAEASIAQEKLAPGHKVSSSPSDSSDSSPRQRSWAEMSEDSDKDDLQVDLGCCPSSQEPAPATAASALMTAWPTPVSSLAAKQQRSTRRGKGQLQQSR